MTNTKFRKRALLSSVAMLLVALVALGSATFAWFVDDPNVTASGITASANTALGLEAKTTTDQTWSHNPNFAKNLAQSVLSPATLTDAGTFHQVKAAAASASTLDTNEKWSEANVGNWGVATTTGVYAEQITFKLVGGATTATLKLTGGTVTTSNSVMNDAVTVAVVYGGKIIAEFNNGTNTAVNKWASITNGNNATAHTGTRTVGVTDAVTIANFTAPNQEITVNVYVYLDGEAASVYTNQAHANQLLQNVQLNFTAAV